MTPRTVKSVIKKRVEMFSMLAWMVVSFATGFGLATAVISHAIAEIIALSIERDLLRVCMQPQRESQSETVCDEGREAESVNAKLD